VAAKPNADLFGGRHHLGQEVDQVLAQPIGIDLRIGGKLRADIIQRPTVIGARQTGHDVVDQTLFVRIGHAGVAGPCAVQHRLRVIVFGAPTREQHRIKNAELQHVEAHGRCAVGHPGGQIGAGPIQDRHEIVADGLKALVGEVAQRLLVGLVMLGDRPGLGLDGLRHRHAFHHVPGESGGGLSSVRPQ
jgi:hypothetical protein